MINKLKHFIWKLKWKRYSWKSMGKNFYVCTASVIHPEYISIGDDFYAEDNLKIQAWKSYREQTFTPSITIKNAVSMMGNCQISCCSSVTIGDGCLFGDNVFITDNFHGRNLKSECDIRPRERELNVKGPVFIGENVWVGRNVCIMPGVTVGNGAVIGANAVVTKDVPAYSIVAGIPAKVIRKME